MSSWLSHSPPERVECGEYVIRKYVLSDAAQLRNQVRKSTEHLRPWMPWIQAEPQTLEDKEDLIRGWEEEWSQRSGFTMGIFLKGDLVGATGYHVRGPEGVLEIGYWVGVNEIGKGIATMCAKELTGVAFLIPEVMAVEIHHDVANPASGRIPEKLGYECEEIYQREPEAPGESGTGKRWVMTKEKWLNSWIAE